MVFRRGKGTTPDNVKFLYPDFFRYGAASTKPYTKIKSLMSAVYFALDKSYDNDGDFIREFFDGLTDSELLLCKQSLYELSSHQILEQYLKDDDLFLDIRDVIDMLEHIFNCHIYTFTKEAKNKNATMIIPRYKDVYLSYKIKYPKCIFIYENYGLTADAKYTNPNYEVFGTSEAKNFDRSDKICKLYRKLYRSCFSQYINGKKLKKIPRNVVLSLAPIKQSFDYNGKVRFLLCNSKEYGNILSPSVNFT